MPKPSGATPVTETIENGLLDLEQRSQSSRRTPPPRHPKRDVEIPPPPVAAEPTAVSKPSKVLDVRERQSQDQPVQAPRKTSPLRATQVYLDEDSDQFLRRCGAAGLIQGSRDVTNSGVIRYALSRLAVEMDPDEVAVAMLDDNSALRRPGRKRT